MNIQMRRKCFLKSEFQFHLKTIIQNLKSVDNINVKINLQEILLLKKKNH